MSDTLVVVGTGSGPGGTSTLPPLPSLTSLITLDALTDLRELLQRHDVRGTLIGISAIRTLLLAELVEHVKGACKDHKRLVEYMTPAASSNGTAPPAAAPPSGTPPGGTSPGGTGGAAGSTGQAAAAASPPVPGTAAEPAPSRFVADFGDKMTAVVKLPVDQLRTTVDGQGEAIDKGAAGIIELQTAKTASDARVQALETNFQQLDTAHRSLSQRVADMDFELGAAEDATDALGVAVSEGEPVQKTQARPMRQAGTSVRKAQARKKK